MLTSSSEDRVVLVDDDGTPVGTAPRSSVHGPGTPLHLAFSCYVIGADGRVLMTRRALAKRTFPGVWTNSFCGHPRPGEPMTTAIARHARHELGIDVTEVTCVLPDFRYRAVDASGVAENEICPVFLASTAATPSPNPDEVMDVAWVHPEELGRAVVHTPWALSPWTVSQVTALADAEPADALAGTLAELAG